MVCVCPGARSGSKNTLYPSVSVYKSETSGEFYLSSSSLLYYLITHFLYLFLFLTSFFPSLLLSLLPLPPPLSLYLVTSFFPSRLLRLMTDEISVFCSSSQHTHTLLEEEG